MKKKDIENLEDIQLMVDTFYGKVQEDELLQGIFNGIIRDKWEQHLEKMYRFWQTVLLKEHSYYGAPFAPHATMPIDAKHFERWEQLFSETIDAHFEGEKADEAKWRAGKMAELFLSKIEYYKNQKND
mgnify:CR=1 FL=1